MAPNMAATYTGFKLSFNKHYDKVPLSIFLTSLLTTGSLQEILSAWQMVASRLGINFHSFYLSQKLIPILILVFLTTR